MGPSQSLQPHDGPTLRVSVFVKKSHFKLPKYWTRPIVLIGPGAGIAPFIGFLQERRFHKNRGIHLGRCALFFGCRTKELDFIYEDELNGFLSDSTLDHLFVAFSRQDPKKYVQDLMKESSHLLYDLVINHHASIYVCGDAAKMSKDVYQTWVEIIADQGGLSTEGSADMLSLFAKDGRYLQDVWT